MGTRAYTADFAPVFGSPAEDDALFVASGLGSSGLTVGPFIGYLLAQRLNTNAWSVEAYQKPISNYLKKVE